MTPLDKMYVTCAYGWRNHPITKKLTFHYGVDLRANYANVRSAARGLVESAEWLGAYGWTIKVNHGAYKSFYAHLDKFAVEEGQTVDEGQVIAISGNSGTLTTGPHLHFGIQIDGKWTDPLAFLEAINMEKTKATFRGDTYEARIDEGKTFIELRKFAEAFGASVLYNSNTKESIITGGIIEELEKLTDKYREV